MSSMEENENYNTPFYNLGEEVKNKSKPTKASKSAVTSKVTEKKVVVSSATMTMAERYKAAWKIIYQKQELWRQKEIDNSQKNGTFGNRDWDTDFVQQVAALAESDNPLAA